MNSYSMNSVYILLSLGAINVVKTYILNVSITACSMIWKFELLFEAVLCRITFHSIFYEYYVMLRVDIARGMVILFHVAQDLCSSSTFRQKCFLLHGKEYMGVK